MQKINHLHNLLKETTEENESLKTQVDKTNKDLESIKDELKTAYEKLYDAQFYNRRNHIC